MSKHPQKTPTHSDKKGKTAQQHAATKATTSQASEQVIHQVYELKLTFQAPLLSQSSETLGVGIDSTMQRYQGQYALNGSLVKGNIRHALEQLGSLLTDSTLQAAITRWLGHKPPEGIAPEDDAAQWQGEARGKVYFDTFWLYTKTLETAQTQKRRNRIKITDKGTVEDGALMSLEDCFALDSAPSFSGQLRASFLDAKEQKQFEDTLDKALQLIPAMGSLKGIGFGRLTSTQLSMPKVASTSSTLKLKSRTYLRLTFKQPFCVGSTSPSDNRIQSENFISGAILKGALAQQYARIAAKANLAQIKLSGRLNNTYQFDQLCFSHALPVAKGSTQRPLPIPLSLVSNGQGLFDASGYTLEQLIEVLGDKTASFQLDWKAKEWAAASRLCNLPQSPKHITLVRTAIDAHRNTAEESKLFSLECVDPHDTEWLCHIDITQTDQTKYDGKNILKNLAQLLNQGIEGIGKTKATARLEIIEAPVNTASSLPSQFTTPFTVKLMLVTQARMLPRQLEEYLLKNSLPDQQSDQVLEQLYQNYWQRHSEQGLSLVRYFARQKRYGGYAAYCRYKVKPYAPEWITEAGSVFVLQIENEQGLNYLKQWQQLGLPAAPETDGSPATWQTTAFIPENGYGEIVINGDILARYNSPDKAYPIQEAKP